MERFLLLRPTTEDNAPLTGVARENNLPYRTAQRWLAAYRREGMAGLAKRPRADQGHCHKVPQELERIIEGLALGKPKPSIANVQRRVAEIAAHYGWREPTYRQVRGVIGRMDAGMLTLAREGEKAYEEAFELVHRMEAERPNELW